VAFAQVLKSANELHARLIATPVEGEIIGDRPGSSHVSGPIPAFAYRLDFRQAGP